MHTGTVTYLENNNCRCTVGRYTFIMGRFVTYRRSLCNTTGWVVLNHRSFLSPHPAASIIKGSFAKILCLDSGGGKWFPVRVDSRALYPAAAGPARPGPGQDPLPQAGRDIGRYGRYLPYATTWYLPVLRIRWYRGVPVPTAPTISPSL